MISIRGLYYPEPINAINTVAQNDTTRIFGNIMSIPKSGNVTHVGYRHGSNAAATVNIKIETVDSDGLPTGTLYKTDAYTAAHSPSSGTWNEVALNDAIAVDSGDEVAVTFQNATAGNMQYQRLNTGISTNYPYTLVFDGATWTKSPLAPLVGLKYDDGNYEYIAGVTPISNLIAQTFNNGSVLTERGVKFNLPFGCEIEGFWTSYGNAVGDFEVRLYEGSTLVYSQAKVANTSNLNSSTTTLIPFANPITINKNTDYYASILATTGTNTSIRHLTYDSAAQLNAISGGDRFTSVRRANPSANWIGYSDERILLGLIISALEEDSGGGGIDSYGYSA
jgi:hypothetical protein